MVLTNYECWASIGGVNEVCDTTLEQAQLRSQIDLFNPHTLGACGITHKVECLQQRGNCDTFPKNVSQISSNGYYGFTYVNNNVDVAGNENDVKTRFRNREADVQHHVFDNNLVTNQSNSIAFGKTSILQTKKRNLVDRESTNFQQSGFAAIAKRCRLETEQEIHNSVDLSEQTRNMDIDDIELTKGANSSYKVKRPNKSVNQNSTLTDNFECDKNVIGNSKTCRTIYVHKFKNSMLKKSGSNELFLEKMFSETHGSGAYLYTQHEYV